jgi:hypothetical protein
MPLREWLRPPRNLLIILFLLTLVSVSALAWFGWKLLEQERVVEAQRLTPAQGPARSQQVFDQGLGRREFRWGGADSLPFRRPLACAT